MASQKSISARRLELQGNSALTKNEAKALIDAARSLLMSFDLGDGISGWTDTEVEKLREAYHKLRESWSFTYDVDR